MQEGLGASFQAWQEGGDGAWGTLGKRRGHLSLPMPPSGLKISLDYLNGHFPQACKCPDAGTLSDSPL